jgi:hypothetical protein
LSADLDPRQTVRKTRSFIELRVDHQFAARVHETPLFRLAHGMLEIMSRPAGWMTDPATLAIR